MRRFILLLVPILLLLSGCGEKAPPSPSPEVPVVDSNGANYPYDDLDEPQYHGYPISPRESERGTLIYNEIREETLPLLCALSADGYGSYDPMNALYGRFTTWIQDAEAAGGISSEDYLWAPLLRTQNSSFLKHGDVYAAFSEDFPELAPFCEDIFLLQQSDIPTGALELHFTSNQSPACCLSTTADGHSVFLIAAEDLSQLGEEVDAFGAYMKELSLGETASVWHGTDLSLSYYYQLIHSSSPSFPTQRFLYYAYLQNHDREYLLQMTSQSVLVNEEKTAPPEGIAMFENVLENFLSSLYKKGSPTSLSGILLLSTENL